jgi:hypothetical protein
LSPPSAGVSGSGGAAKVIRVAASAPAKVIRVAAPPASAPSGIALVSKLGKLATHTDTGWTALQMKVTALPDACIAAAVGRQTVALHGNGGLALAPNGVEAASGAADATADAALAVGRQTVALHGKGAAAAETCDQAVQIAGCCGAAPSGVEAASGAAAAGAWAAIVAERIQPVMSGVETASGAAPAGTWPVNDAQPRPQGIAAAGAWAATDAQRKTQDVAAGAEAAVPPSGVEAASGALTEAAVANDANEGSAVAIGPQIIDAGADQVSAVAAGAGPGEALLCASGVSGALGVSGVSATIGLLLAHGPPAGPANTVTRPKHQGVVNNFGTPAGWASHRLEPGKGEAPRAIS